ncbi:MAG: glycosyltransferase [Bryobacterales bacterium]|jgi:glycosyltransferase involved in cell wall biosynthesis|nr:glycosyltransferase [Bryobacterales bacterium]
MNARSSLGLNNLSGSGRNDTAAPALPPVLLLVTHLALGGAEAQVAMLARQLRSRGWPVSVVSLRSPTAHAAELQAEGIPVHTLAMEPGKPRPTALLRYLRLLRQGKPAIIHAHLFHANMLARLGRLLCPTTAVISTIHSLAESSQRSAAVGLRDTLYRISDAYSHRTVCVSEAVAARHRQAGAIRAHRSIVIGNGADPSRFHPCPTTREETRAALALGDTFTFLAVGRLMWKKDYASLLRAMAQLPRESTQCPRATLLIAGDGEQRRELQALASALDVDVRFLGARDDIPALMQAADAFVLSSLVEGLPVVLLEAALSALPCVATDVGGVAEALCPQARDFLARPNHPASLATNMARVLALSSVQRRALGEAARKDALQRFTAQAIASQWEGLYRTLLREVGARLED